MKHSSYFVISQESADEADVALLTRVLGAQAVKVVEAEPGDTPAQESQQIDEHVKSVTEAELGKQLAELALDKKFTGTHRVYVMAGAPISSPNAAQQGLLKAIVDQAISTDSPETPSAVFLADPTIDSTTTAADAFADEYAALETFLKPFGVTVYPSVHSYLQTQQ